MEAIVKERDELNRVQQELEKKQKETINNIKGQVVKYFEENKDKLKSEKKEKEDVKKFIEKSTVKAIFDKYDVPLRYFFDFYSKSEHHGISFELDQNMETMNQKEFVRFAYQSNIVPALLPIDETNRQFKILVRERQDERSDVRLQVLDYDYFLKALVRIAALSQDYLGGQRGARLEKRMEELNKEREKNLNLKKTLAKRYETAKSTKSGNASENSLDRGGETSGYDTGKDTSRERVDLSKKGAKKPNKKIIKEGFKETKLK